MHENVETNISNTDDNEEEGSTAIEDLTAKGTTATPFDTTSKEYMENSSIDIDENTPNEDESTSKEIHSSTHEDRTGKIVQQLHLPVR